MTPGRLNELRCPRCQQVTWVIDSDYRGMNGVMVPYNERRYTCGHCRRDGPGWTLGQQSPTAFLLQPHNLYPMTQAAFDYWVGILQTHFPTCSLLNELGTTFRPRLPEEVEAIRKAAHHAVETEEQDETRSAEPDLREWLARVWNKIIGPS